MVLEPSLEYLGLFDCMFYCYWFQLGITFMCEIIFFQKRQFFLMIF
jgi:hypothetical protein